MTFFDPNNQIIKPSAIGGQLIIDDEKGKLIFFNYHISLPKGMKVSAVIGRTIYLIGAGIMGTITFTIVGDGVIQYWGIYKEENVHHVLSFCKGQTLENEQIGWTVR